VILVTIGAAVAPAMAGKAEGSFIIGGNPAPVVGSIELYDGGNPADEMTPQTEYELCMTVTDESTLSDIAEITVVIKEGRYSGEDCATDQATYIWTSSGWSVSTAGTTWEIVTANSNVPTLTDTSGDWVLAFKPGKVTREEKDGWGFTVTATDSEVQSDFTMPPKPAPPVIFTSSIQMSISPCIFSLFAAFAPKFIPNPSKDAL
jgi:hypothetical protein